MPTRKAPAGYMPNLPPGCTQRFFRDGDEEALLVLLQDAFNGTWPKRTISVPPLEHLRWKLRSHRLATNLHVVAEQGGRIIAARPLWVSPLQIEGSVLLSRQAVDLAVLPEFQRLHLMSAMEARTPRARIDLVDVAVGLGNRWQKINFVPGTPYRRNIDVVARSLEGAVSDSLPEEWTLRRVESFDDRIDELWRQASRSFRAIFVRTADCLNYRYADPRAGDYTIVIAEQGEHILGYIIYTYWQGTGQIADALVLPERPDVLASLLHYAAAQLRRAGNDSVECWRDTYHPYGSALEKLHFNEPRRSQRITLHSLRGHDDGMAFFADPKSAVHIMAGDTDLV